MKILNGIFDYARALEFLTFGRHQGKGTQHIHTYTASAIEGTVLPDLRWRERCTH